LELINDDLENEAQKELTKEMAINKNMTMAQLKYEEGLTQDQYDQVSIPDTDKNSNNNDIQSNVMHL
jgi:hypothetical protein